MGRIKGMVQRKCTNLVLNLEEKNILFSWQDKNQLIIFIYVTAKYYIYANKFSGKALNLDVYITKEIRN